MTTPPCNPATLRGPCGGVCGRQLHSRNSRQRSPKCSAGHPTHHSNDMCSGCIERTRTRTRARAGISYCTHDEGEPCTCEATS